MALTHNSPVMLDRNMLMPLELTIFAEDDVRTQRRIRVAPQLPAIVT